MLRKEFKVLYAGGNVYFDTSKLEEPKWYVLHTFTGYENMAVDNLNKCIIKNNLQDYILEVKIPMETVIEEDKNGKKKAERLLKKPTKRFWTIWIFRLQMVW